MILTFNDSFYMILTFNDTLPKVYFGKVQMLTLKVKKKVNV